MKLKSKRHYYRMIDKVVVYTASSIHRFSIIITRNNKYQQRIEWVEGFTSEKQWIES